MIKQALIRAIEDKIITKNAAGLPRMAGLRNKLKHIPTAQWMSNALTSKTVNQVSNKLPFYKHPLFLSLGGGGLAAAGIHGLGSAYKAHNGYSTNYNSDLYTLPPRRPVLPERPSMQSTPASRPGPNYVSKNTNIPRARTPEVQSKPSSPQAYVEALRPGIIRGS